MKSKTNSDKSWVIYLLECKDGSLYTGITNDLEKRLASHNAGLGAKYTRGRRPVTLLEFKTAANQSEALRLEFQIKKLPRLKKSLFFKS